MSPDVIVFWFWFSFLWSKLHDDCPPDDLTLPAVSPMEGSHDEDGEGEDETEGGEEHVGEVGDREDGHSVDVQGVEDPGPGHKDGHQRKAGVEDKQRGQGMRGEEEAAPGPRHRLLVLVSKPGHLWLIFLIWVQIFK